MNSELNSFVVLSASVLIVLSISAAGVAVAGSVLYRSTVVHREVATRKALGARRSDIARMFLSENVLGVAVGIAIGSAALLATGRIILIGAATLLTAAGLIGGWIAGRYAADTPVSKSGRFRTAPDI
ncbi:MAG TPA: FtsX-like permease family protein [Steroidobacteraceae bacterium]|nr:FtsX-like permease family protein [Steroidobacteraceae bacterium]